MGAAASPLGMSKLVLRLPKSVWRYSPATLQFWLSAHSMPPPTVQPQRVLEPPLVATYVPAAGNEKPRPFSRGGVGPPHPATPAAPGPKNNGRFTAQTAPPP